MVEPLLSGLVLGLITVSALCLFVAAQQTQASIVSAVSSVRVEPTKEEIAREKSAPVWTREDAVNNEIEDQIIVRSMLLEVGIGFVVLWYRRIHLFERLNWLTAK